MNTTVTTSSEGKTWDGGNEPMGASYGKMMMWIFLVSDTFIFGSFLIAYTLYQLLQRRHIAIGAWGGKLADIAGEVLSIARNGLAARGRPQPLPLHRAPTAAAGRRRVTADAGRDRLTTVSVTRRSRPRVGR